MKVFKGLGEVLKVAKEGDITYPCFLRLENGKIAYIRSICLKCLRVDVSINGHGEDEYHSCDGTVPLVHRDYDPKNMSEKYSAMTLVNTEVAKLLSQKKYRTAIGAMVERKRNVAEQA
jgi:hypothetical protein